MQLITALPGLNLQQPNGTVIHAVQDDSLTRWYSAPLLVGSTLWTPPSGASAFVSYRRGDGVPGLYDRLEDGTAAVSWDGSTVTFGLSDHALAAAGRGELAICFTLPASGTATERLSSFRAILDVEATPYPAGEIVESEPYVNILSAQIAAVLEAAADFAGLTVSATTLAAGKAASATVTGGTNGEPYKIAFGIPRGQKGDKGDKGDKGEPGADGNGAVDSVMGVRPTQGDVPKEKLFELIYPVGSIYISASSTSPASLFGGTWSRIQGKFLLAADSGHAAGSTGGASTQTVDFSNGQADIGFGDASAGYLSMRRKSDGAGHFHPFAPVNTAPLQWTGAQASTADATELQGNQTLDNMPPYLAVYVWQRTK